MLNQDFKEFRQLLNDNQVKYLASKIDLITTPDGRNFDICYQTKIEVLIENIPVNFIDLDNLIKNKQASGRMQDLADLEN